MGYKKKRLEPSDNKTRGHTSYLYTLGNNLFRRKRRAGPSPEASWTVIHPHWADHVKRRSSQLRAIAVFARDAAAAERRRSEKASQLASAADFSWRWTRVMQSKKHVAALTPYRNKGGWLRSMAAMSSLRMHDPKCRLQHVPD